MMLSNLAPFMILMGIATGPIVIPFVVIAIVAIFTDTKKGKPNDSRVS